MKRLDKALLLLALLTSCAKIPDAQDVGTNHQSQFVPMTLNLYEDTFGTKAPDDVTDCAIGNLQILEFDSKGYCVFQKRLEYESHTEIQVLENQNVRIYAIANPSNDLSEIATESEFLNTVMLYSDFNPSRPEMTGTIEGIFSAGCSSDVILRRICSKIQVDTLVFRVSSSLYDYYKVLVETAYMKRTPDNCSYGLEPSEHMVNANSESIEAGILGSRISSVDYFMDGDWKVWEYDNPFYVYSLPNSSSETGTRSVFYIKYTTLYKTGEYYQDDHWIATKTESYELHICLPPLMPNTVYELGKIVVNQPKSRIIDMDCCKEVHPLPAEEDQCCVFTVKDMTTGEVLGYEKGYVSYEDPDI